MLKCINEIYCNRSSSGHIPAKLIRIAKEEVIVAISNCINKCVSSSTFPDVLKITHIEPVYKSQDFKRKTTYQLIHLLPIISKIFE